MSEFQVNCITKSHHQGGHEHITHIGSNLGKKWRMTKEAAIVRIERRTDPEKYFTRDTKGNKAYIAVVRPTSGSPYLRTIADGKWSDNLLAQATCDGDCSTIG